MLNAQIKRNSLSLLINDRHTKENKMELFPFISFIQSVAHRIKQKNSLYCFNAHSIDKLQKMRQNPFAFCHFSGDRHSKKIKQNYFASSILLFDF